MNTVVSRPKPQMLRPTARVYPFDEVGSEIVNALEARNWDIPGIDVEFDVYGRGDAQYRYLKRVSGKNFRLQYGRPQGRMGYFNNVAALHRIAIMKKDLRVFDDMSGPAYEEYVGTSWRSDKERFLSGSLGRYTDMDGQILEFRAWCDCNASTMRHSHPRRISPKLIAIGESGRSYRTDDLFKEFTDWLTKNVLNVIQAQPLVEPDYTRFDVVDIPYPENGPELFSYATFMEGVKIRTGKSDPTLLPEHERYAFDIGRRLVSLGVSDKASRIPGIAYEGFVWCGVGPVTADSTVEDAQIADEIPWDHVFVCRVVPNRANDVYVADHAAYTAVREELAAKIGDRDSFTDEELNEMYLARGRTIVPITEYDGSYTQPVVLIMREVGFDEVEIVSGPHGREKWMKEEWEATS